MCVRDGGDSELALVSSVAKRGVSFPISVKGVGRYGLAMVVLAALLRMPADPSTHASALTEHHVSGLPRVILWAWDRSEDLSFIDPHKAGVAYLARTLYLEGDLSPRDDRGTAAVESQSQHPGA
jgi:hypothetical protein